MFSPDCDPQTGCLDGPAATIEMNIRKKSLGLEITTAIGCKNACEYCPQRLLVRSSKKRGGLYMMSEETFVQCIDKVPLDVSIYFSGYCEPWQNPNCTNFVEYTISKGHQVSVFTTLYGMSKDDIARLSALALDELVIHLPDANGAMKIDVDEEYLAILEQFERTRFDSNMFAYMLFGEPHPKVLDVIGSARLWKMVSRAGNVDSSIKSAPSRLSGPIVCAKLRHIQNVLLPNGDVTLCCMDYGLQHVIGNLLRNSYHVLHRSPEFMRVMEGMSADDGDILCRTCEWAARIEGKHLIDHAGTIVGELTTGSGQPMQADTAVPVEGAGS
jgi:hypothetical protein